jgi:hypothetical protein
MLSQKFFAVYGRIWLISAMKALALDIAFKPKFPRIGKFG